jgi:hypothetical protein
VRILEKAVFKGLFGTARSRAHYAGKQANASVKQHDRGRFAAGQDNVANRNRFDVARLENPLVEAFETATQHDHAWPDRQLANAGLIERLAARRQGKDRATRLQSPCMVDAGRKYIGLQHHACPAASGRVIDRAVLVSREIPDVDGIERPLALFERPARQ